jgi:tetratricopeptide (TPR) repeat protein
LVLEKTGNTRAAIAAYTAVTQTNPSFTPAHLHLGLALRDSGQRNEALISLKAALQLDPSCKEASEAISGLSDTKL